MSFPAAGVAIPAAVAGNNISFNNLRLSYVNNGNNGAWSNGDAKDSNGAKFSLSEFNGATFTSGDTINGDGSQSLSIRSHFCDNTFGSSATTYYLQINNDDALTNIRYTIDASTYLSWTSGAGGDPTNAVITAIGNSGELVYTDTNNEISVSIQRQDSEGKWANASSITLFDTSGGSGLTVPITPTADNTFTITWTATGSPGSPQILGISSN